MGRVGKAAAASLGKFIGLMDWSMCTSKGEEVRQIEITFTKEKETKNTVRYSEDTSDGPPKVGTIYVQQWALRRLGLTGGEFPNRLKVTIEVVA